MRAHVPPVHRWSAHHCPPTYRRPAASRPVVYLPSASARLPRVVTRNCGSNRAHYLRTLLADSSIYDHSGKVSSAHVARRTA